MLNLPVPSLLLLTHLAALLTPAALAQYPYTSSDNETPRDNNENCTCYVVSSGADANTPSYFQYYRFYDFRNLPDAMRQPPPLVNDTATAGLEPTWQPGLFNSAAWNDDWGLQNWSKPATDDFPTPMNNSLANIYLGQENNVSFLALRTARQETYQTAAEMENQQKNLMHVSMRMHARVRGDKGAVAGFFTFFDDSNESDIEILTDDPTSQIRYTNQPSVDKHGNEIAAASLGPTNLASWENWQTHRIDWLPKHSYWYLNNQQVAANGYSVPRKPSFLVINMWSDGGEWSGKMQVNGSAVLEIQWIEMAFNTSGPYSGSTSRGKRDESSTSLAKGKRAAKRCQTVCKIDDVAQIGTPEVVSTSSGAMGLSVSWGFFGMVVFVGFMAGY